MQTTLDWIGQNKATIGHWALAGMLVLAVVFIFQSRRAINDVLREDEEDRG